MAPGRFIMGVVACLAIPLSPSRAVTCDNEQRLDGTLEGVSIDVLDPRLGSVTVAGSVLAVDADTVLKDNAGASIMLSVLETHDPVRVRFCPDTRPLPTALRVDRLTGPAATPVPDTLNLDVAPGTESQPVRRVFGDDPGERLGAGTTDAIAFGDVNGDGFDDTIIGAPAADSPAGDAGGVVYVIYGGPQGPASPVDLDTDGAISQAGETRILGAQAGARLGQSVTSADVDGDGLDDIVVGAPNASGQGPATGEVVIVYGSTALPGAVVDLAQASDTTIVLGDDAQGRTGVSLASGDIDADGRADVIIGAPGDAPGASRQGGSVMVIYGDPALRGTTIDLNTEGAISPAGETRIFGDRAGDQTGVSVASGDVNGDGLGDIIIGANRADALFTTNRGATYVVYGSVGLPGTIIDLSTTRDAVGPARETRIFGRVANSWLGTSVASGDVDNDGLDDIVLSATGITGLGDNFQVGEVYVVYGRAGLPGTLVDLSASPGTTRITGQEEFVEFGFSVASADIDADGFDDLILGAPQSVPPGGAGNAAVNDGLVFILKGSSGLRGQQLVDPREVADLIVVRDNPGDLWGHSVEAGGDLDADGVPDYAASAAQGDNPGLGGDNNAGSVVAVFGTPPSKAVTTRIEHSVAGDAPPTDFGPVARAVIDYAAGGGPSTDSVTLIRRAPPIPPQGVMTVLPVHWRITTDRTSFEADVRLAYTDAELGVVDETRLVVYASPTGEAGSWVRAGSNQDLDLAHNQIRVRAVSGFSLFAIAQVTGPPAVFTLSVARTGSGTGRVTGLDTPAGIDCGEVCVQRVPAATALILRASPDPGSSFAGWSGPCGGIDDCVLAMDADRAVTAEFTADAIPAVTSGGGGGGSLHIAAILMGMLIWIWRRARRFDPQS